MASAPEDASADGDEVEMRPLQDVPLDSDEVKFSLSGRSAVEEGTGVFHVKLTKRLLGWIAVVLVLGVILLSVIVWQVCSSYHHESTAQCSSPSETLPGDIAGNVIFEDYWQDVLAHSPETASFLGDKSGDGRLSDLSNTAASSQLQRTTRFLQRVDTLLDSSEVLAAQVGQRDSASMSASTHLSLQVLQHLLRVRVEASEYPGERLMPLTQLSGPQIELPQLVSFLSIRTVQDARNYLSRLQEIPRYLLQTQALMAEGLQRGFTPPKAILNPVRAQLDHQLEPVPASVYYSPFREPKPDAVTVAEWSELSQTAAGIIETDVIPAWQALIQYWTDEYQPNARDTLGATSLPNGEAYYRYKVLQQTTLPLTFEQINATGWNELLRIRGEMDSIMDSLNFTGGFLAFSDFLRTDPRFFFTSEQALLAHVRDICKRADAQLPALFGRLPRCPYGVKPIPAAEAPSAPAAYYFDPSADCSRPGFYYTNTYDLPSRPWYLMESTTLHETVPGHHLQIALAQELPNQPQFRRVEGFTSFVEGWALYVERLGPVMGFYTDPYTQFGALGDEILRALRLIVDVGMHAFGMGREEAVQLMLSNSPLSEVDIRAEVDRYLAWPGQALAYKTGELAIKALRSEVENHLGNDFDIRKFHDTVLGQGALPLPLLQQHVRTSFGVTGA